MKAVHPRVRTRLAGPWLALLVVSCSSLLGIEEPTPRDGCRGEGCAGGSDAGSPPGMALGGSPETAGATHQTQTGAGPAAFSNGGAAGSVEGGAAGARGDECADDERRCDAYQPQVCERGYWQPRGGECPGFCTDGACKQARSCEQTAPCASGASCCDTIWIEGGTYRMGQGDDEEPDLSYARAVSGFYLDRFEVTVGRFSAFVGKYALPEEGAGAHPRLPGTGWRKSWEALPHPDFDGETAVPANATQLMTQIGDPDHCTYGNTWNEADAALPITCVSWYAAFAFCAFDGGRLPTEAEWNYAAAHGASQRPYPWSASVSDLEVDASRAVYWQDPDSILPEPVGSRPAGRGGFFRNPGQGHDDLAGNVFEWTLDQWLEAPPDACDGDCAAAWETDERVVRGGGFALGFSFLRTGFRGGAPAAALEGLFGFRCARDATTLPEETP